MDALTEVAETFELPGIWNLTPYGAVLGLLVILYWLLATGRLVPRNAHERELAARDAAHATNLALANKRGDEWKETAQQGHVVIKEQSGQLGKFADAARAPAEFFGTVIREGGGDRVAQTDSPST
ncbi:MULTISPECIES: hypothetical protein [unclassified Microbacterium]|uniref:hypothetical protein n=1 Tax=unclassified Microbacterium TaxID=2609290 RepID=UPI000EA918AA|nr:MULTISPECIES: hypothetical protein [unclassified Microbacterium]MBT2485821.1 hypothetical protein [Microbacterium sp. ISL-108]RKN68584.1 hypothetical protein D7252_13985 [Microbacterium sp. CGR2]